MSIDRNNYEMFFLLYVDNELCAEERIAVEKFVLENTDLKPELELLISTTLPAVEVVYITKNDLYKKEKDPDLLKEKMLLYLDNELELSAVVSLESAITSDNILKKEWNILQQTKLDRNDKIVFENKQLLYRHENDNVIPIGFWRAAVAAAIIGAGLFIGFSIFTKNKNVENIAVTNKNANPVQKNIQPGIIIPKKENNIQQQELSENIATNQQEKIKAPVKENIVHQQEPSENIVSTSPKDKKVSPAKKIITTHPVINNNMGKEMAHKETNNLPKPYFENINNNASNKISPLAVQDNIQALQNKNEDVKTEEKNIAKAIVKDPQIPVEDNTLTETHNSYAKNTVLNETNSETNNDHILFMTEEKINHSKIGGLFRKVKRVLARNTNIKTGNNIKIAGFEIAAR